MKIDICNAVEKNDVEAVKFCLDEGVDIEAAVDHNGSTALIRAAIYGHQGIVELLLDNGANIEAVDQNRRTALIHSAIYGHQGIVELLLDNGTNIEAVGKYGDTALIHSVQNGHQGTVELLLDRGANSDNISNENLVKVLFGRSYESIIEAAKKGDQEIIEFFLNRSANIEAVDQNGRTALMYAALNGHQEIVKLLIDKGANIEAVSRLGATALMFAALKGQQETVKLLLGRGANIEAADQKGITALKVATMNSHMETVKLLLDVGAEDSINYKDIDNYPYISRFVSIPNMLQKFLDNGMDINLSDENDNSLFTTAVNADNIESIKFFIKNKADINYKNFDGKTPLSFARSDEVKELLTNKGAVDSKCNYCSEAYSSYESHKKRIDGFCSQDCSFKADEPIREKMRLAHEAKLAEEQRKHNEQLAILAAREAEAKREHDRKMAIEEIQRQRQEERQRQEKEEERQRQEKEEERQRQEKEEERQRQESLMKCQWCSREFEWDWPRTSVISEDRYTVWCSEKCYTDYKMHGGRLKKHVY